MWTKNQLSVIFFFIFSLCFASTTRFTQVDLIIQNLEDQIWQPGDKACLDETLLLLNNVKNHTLWAMWIWNSIQQPTGVFYGSKYSLGNYDQCLQAPDVAGDRQVLTQYCLVDIKLTDGYGKKEHFLDTFSSANDFLKATFRVGRTFNTLTWGICLPAVCKPQSVNKISKAMYIVHPLSSEDPVITVDHCETANQESEFDFKVYVFFAVSASLVIIAIASTIYMQFAEQDTKLRRIAHSFNLLRNWSSLVKTSEDDIPILNCYKTALIIMTTIIHSAMFLIMGGIGNSGYYDSRLKKRDWTGSLMRHMDLPTVDNFFVISGLLVMKSLITGKKTPLVTLIQRYIRLIGSLAFLIFYTLTVSNYAGDGPLWGKLYRKELKACEENWFWTLLMMNNYIKNEATCQIISWSAISDYQLAVLATALFCIWKWNKRAGKLTTIMVSILALVSPGVVTFWRRMPGVLFYEVDKIIDVRNNVVFLETYVKSHHRAGPYLLGLGVGYLMSLYKPSKFRGVISARLCIIGSIIALVLASKAMIWMEPLPYDNYNALDSAIFASLVRNLFAITTCMFIIIGEYGDIPNVRSILAWRGFTVCSRLAYGVYITHSVIMQRHVFSQRSPLHYDFLDLIINGLGVLAGASVCAAVLWLFVEAPLNNLTNLILTPKNPEVVEITYKKQPTGQMPYKLKKNG